VIDDIFNRPPEGQLTVLNTVLTISKRFDGFLSREFPGKRASNSEIRRWIANGSVSINDVRYKDLHAIVDWPLTEFSLFPNGRKVTLH